MNPAADAGAETQKRGGDGETWPVNVFASNLQRVAWYRRHSRRILSVRIRSTWIAVLVCVSATSPLLAQKNSCPTDRPHTLYSHFAADLENDGEPIIVPSPDRKSSVTAVDVAKRAAPEGVIARYTVHRGGDRFVTELDGWNAEILWSPDSSAFAVSQTEGGGGIGQRVYVFYLEPNGIRKVDVSRVVEAVTGPSSHCDGGKFLPNTAAITWLGPQRLLVAAETFPIGGCVCSGSFVAYEISLQEMKVERAYSQREAKRKFWAQLGCELRDADDRCAASLPAAKAKR